ncbi:Avirulence protein [Phytophthora palmivora]|uniref:Avirulence protein n=1 Tax=Phytophthora palmivora TaxID=4796 RepID=A0A2P4X697_9STRA|nr:Avirulence protein [Phytophthora palmivora]
MKSSDRWLGQPVYKLGMDNYGREIQISGKIMSYSPSSGSDGSSDGVPVHEIGDHVPLHLHLPVKKHRSKKRRAENHNKTNSEREATSPSKRSKTEENGPSAAWPDRMTVVSRFVQDTLWSLTTVLDVCDEKQRLLFTALDNRNEQHLHGMLKKEVLTQ